MATNETQIGIGAPRATPMPGLSLVSSRYRVDSLIGGGGCGLVYRARRDGAPVAIKVLRPELVRSSSQSLRFFREARLAATLHHPNIVDISDFGNDEQSGAPYLVMELLSGRTLATDIREHGAQSWKRAASVLHQICRALVCAHTQGVIHRDLAPHNIMLEGDRVKVCDFGLSRLRNGDSFVGTPAYMAPEQIRDGDQDERCDLYAVGVLGFEMLTGALPYRATSPVALVSEILGGGHIAVRERLGDGIPEVLVSVIERCLAHAPDARPASADQIERELATIIEPEPVPVPEPIAEPIEESVVVAPVADESAPPVLDLVGQVIGSYRVTGPLGSGGHSSVWLAEHPVIGTKVAIKVLRPEIAAIEGVVDRFTNEARATSMIASPHIARYLDLGRLPNGQPYAILEYLIGETLQQRLEHGKPLKLSTAVAITRQAASVLGQAHALGIIHRDIKPGNIFLTDGETGVIAKVIDFGVAKLTGPAAPADAATSQHGFVGTTLYCAPEQITGDEITTAADVYALGATLYELLAGHPPFTGDELTSAKTSQAAPPIEDGPIHLSALVADMLSLAPNDRPTMSEVMERLAVTPAAPRFATAAAVEASADAHVDAPLDAPFGGLAKRFQPRKTLVPWIVAGVGLAALVIFVLWSFSGSPDTTPRKQTNVATDKSPKADPADVKTAAAVAPPQETKPATADTSATGSDPAIEMEGDAKKADEAKKADAAKVAEAKAAEAKAAEDKAAEAKAAEAKAAEAKAAEAKAAEDKAAEAKAAEAKVAEAKKADEAKHAKSTKSSKSTRPSHTSEPAKAKSDGDVIIADPFKN